MIWWSACSQGFAFEAIVRLTPGDQRNISRSYDQLQTLLQDSGLPTTAEAAVLPQLAQTVS